MFQTAMRLLIASAPEAYATEHLVAGVPTIPTETLCGERLNDPDIYTDLDFTTTQPEHVCRACEAVRDAHLSGTSRF